MLLPLLGGRGKPLYIAEHTVDVRILMLLVMIGMPMFLAGALSVALGKFDFWSNKVPTFTPFFATRAYSTTGFVVTKWIAAAINALVVWAIVLIFLTLFLLTSTATERSQICHVLAATPARAIVKIVLLLAMFIFVTWRNQVTGFFVPMFGRAWFTNAMSFAGWLQFTAMATAGYGLYLYPAARSGVLTAVPWVIWGIAALKLVIAACLIRILRQADVVSASSMKMVWLALSAGFVALCAILYGIGGFSPLLIPAAILLLPMNRAGLAPLTLRANRHR
jgi:hypothetical protein